MDTSCSKLELKQNELKESETKFRRACSQILLLNQQLEDMKERYTRAKRDNFRCFRYNLRLRLAVIEGTRNMYYEYAQLKAETIANLREELFGELVEIVTGDTDTDDDDLED